MGVVRFSIGEIANAGMADGIEGAVQDGMEKLPKELFFWIDGANPSSHTPYAEHHDGVIVIGVVDESCRWSGGDPALGIRTIEGIEIIERTSLATSFRYQGSDYRVMHNTQPRTD